MKAAKLKFVSDIIGRYRAETATAGDKAMVKDLKLRMLDLCSRSVNKAELELFGSLASGFCTARADADFSLTFRNFSPWLSGLREIDELYMKRLTRVARQAGELGMADIRMISARVPVVQFRDPVSEVHCDITIGNLGGVENSQILAAIHNKLPDFYGAYIFVVKEWAKNCEVVAPEKSTFNSFAITTMALMVLQELRLLPVFRPSGELGQLTLADATAALDAFELPPVYEGIEQDDERLGEAAYYCLLRFAEYYSKFDFSNGTVSLMCPRRHRTLYAQIVKKHLELFATRKRQAWIDYIRSEPSGGAEPVSRAFPQKSFDAAMHSEAVQRAHNSPYVVEDFVNYINCGRRAEASRGTKLRKEFNLLYERLRNEDAVSYAEVFQKMDTLPLTFDPNQSDERVLSVHTKRR